MGIYIFDVKALVPVLEADARRSTAHDFGRDIIPELVARAPVYAYRFTDENKKEAKYWRDIGTLDAYYEANMDLCRVNPEFNLYDPEWPLRTQQVQAPPAKFVFADEGKRCGQALDSIISAGCIISGSRISGSVLCPNVRVHSFCAVEQSILMPGVRVGRHARIRRAIIDRDVFIPRGALIGYNEDEDRQRHTVTERGIVVVTTDDEPYIGPDQRRGAGERAGVRSTRLAVSATPRRTRTAMPTITRVIGREILDSRGNPTIEVEVTLDEGAVGRAGVPSGASTGEREALELRDGDKSRYLGKGVRTAAGHVNGEIAQAILGREADQRAIDAALIELDGTPNKGRLGANAILGVSMALARATAQAERVPLYEHLATLYGGAHVLAAGADDEHPQRRRARRQQRGLPGVHGDAASGAPSFAEGLRAGAEIFHTLRGILKKKGYSTGVGDEGGFAPSLKSNREALDVVMQAIDQAGYKAGDNVFIALDVAASELWNEAGKNYEFKKSGEQTRSADEMVALYRGMGARVPDHLDRGRPRGRRLGRLADADERARRRGRSSSATTCSSPTPRSSSAASPKGSPTRCW